MLVHPNFDPVAVSLGPVQIHWYGLMYVLGFLGVYTAWLYRTKHHTQVVSDRWNAETISDLLFYGALGVVIGGRLGYVLFYKPMEYLTDPLSVFLINQGGMSFHGGLAGVAIALWLFSRKIKLPMLEVYDFVALAAPIGLFFGRIGNFINQELWGKVTDMPWGMVFTVPGAGDQPRHPSMLYEAMLEGLLLFVILWFVGKKTRRIGVLSGVFLAGYAIARILVEFVRVPDAHLNYLFFDWVTMGQLLSLPMLLVGVLLIITAKPRPPRHTKPNVNQE